MPDERVHGTPSLVAEPSQPFVGLIVDEDGQEVVRYFTEPDAEPGTSAEEDVRAALTAIGAWADLDWDDALKELDRIRHESVPTPSIEL